jgi:hypothetical protein
MRGLRSLGAVVVLAAIGIGAAGPADAQSKAGATKTAATPARGATLSANAKKPIDAKTKAELTRRITAAYGHMGTADRVAMSQSLWGLYQVLRDPGPVPHVTPRPPVEPPAEIPCADCGKRQAYPADPCAGLRAELKDILRQQILKGLIVDQLQKVLQALADMEFYGGVADLVGNIVTTTTGLVTAGAGGALGKAAVNALKGIAMDQIKGAIVDALSGALPPPLDNMSGGNLTATGINGIIGALTAQISALNAQKIAKINALNACTASYSATLKTIDKSNAAVIDCMRAKPNYCL